MQDNSCSRNDGVVDADQTLQALTQAIVSAGGPNYDYIDNPPQNNQDGGQPGGNIRVAYLFNPEAVEVAWESVTRITDADLSDGDAFQDSRYPILKKQVRSFQHFLWKDMPDSMMPFDWYSVEEQEVLRLSSKSHWDIPVSMKGRVASIRPTWAARTSTPPTSPTGHRAIFGLTMSCRQ